MLLPFSPVALAAIVLSTPFAFALSPSDIPVDTPVSKLLTTANQKLASGQAQEALTYFDVAISRDPSNYLTVFKRGAAYLSLGKTQQAHQDFNKALALKPDFEGALLQRAKIHSRNGKWADAKKDFLAAGKKGGTEISELEEAQGAATLAEDAANKGDWDACVAQAGVAIIVAGTALDLRKLRARCRFEKGEVAEGVSDLQHVLQINSGSTEPHMQISAMSYYSLGEREAGLSQIRKCLLSDPDSKPCRKLMRREKALAKDLKKVEQLMEKRQFNSATKLILPKGEDAGLLQEVKGDIKQYKEEGLIYKNSPEGLYNKLVEMTCECYMEMNTRKKAQPYCREALVSNPGHLQGLLCKAQNQLDADDFEPAINTLNEAKKYHEGSQKIQEMLNNAQTLLKRSKQKDYYKVLGVDRDADERDIKRAYRKLSMKFHPDKAGTEGISKEEAETKMASINEAYEVLSDPELKARFDRGDDPNNPEQAGPFGGSPFGQGGGGHQFFFRTGPGQGFPGGFPGGQFKFSQEGGGAGGFQFPGGFDFP